MNSTAAAIAAIDAETQEYYEVVSYAKGHEDESPCCKPILKDTKLAAVRCALARNVNQKYETAKVYRVDPVFGDARYPVPLDCFTAEVIAAYDAYQEAQLALRLALRAIGDHESPKRFCNGM